MATRCAARRGAIESSPREPTPALTVLLLVTVAPSAVWTRFRCGVTQGIGITYVWPLPDLIIFASRSN